jgi:Domain of unknown function (DUF1996)
MLDSNGAVVRPTPSLIYYKGSANAFHAEQKKIVTPGKALRMIGGDQNGSSSTPQNRDLYFECESTKGVRAPHIVACPKGSSLRVHLSFPTCWNGKPDSPDHRSHVVYRKGGQACPSTHPKLLTHISFVIKFPVTATTGTAGWHLSSDKPGDYGHSFHADWFNGWDMTLLEDITEHCNRKPQDCHANLVGDGRWLGRPE